MSCQNPTSSDLPGRPNATIRSPAVARTRNQGPGRGTGAFAVIDALICRYLFALTGETAMPRPYGRGGALRFRSLRLSVRTPPFHGGESGSIPLGSASGCPKHLSPRGRWQLAGLGDAEGRRGPAFALRRLKHRQF